MSEETRLKRFIADQEEAVQLARATPSATDPIRMDALNTALSLAHCNQEPGQTVSVDSLIRDARQIERFLRATE